MNMTFVKLAVIHISVLYIFLPVGNTCGPYEYRSGQGLCCPMCNKEDLKRAVLYILVTFGNTCGPSEYKSSKGECCPMCYIGSVVYRECSKNVSTACILCSPGTFMNEPNGLYECITCRNCSKSQGLYIQIQCNTIKDAVCGVLDGYYCVEYFYSHCQRTQKHRVCNPGQGIKTPGMKRSDTKCEDCPSGFYSPMGLNCTRWTNCAAKNEIEIETGSSIKDVTCTPRRSRYGLYIAAVPAAVTFILICMHLFLKPGITRKYMQGASELNL
ncbi:tumor necrosis factor receptor superfamily member 5 isoform X1 [Paramisgurnus dabryanus]|uniref:tumor necrosis factor receptor superfamily member 5 isoform X1 n=1 Tax=Paramisgurnus dabryanus TaxID=90735 RepID=UPI0031F3BBED